MEFKRFAALLLTLVVVASCFVMPASAASTVDKKFGVDETYICTIEPKKNKTGEVTITIPDVTDWVASEGVTITMKDENGRYIWGEDYSIPFKYNALKHNYTGSRKYTFGSDHKVYKIYLRKTKHEWSGGTMNVTVKSPKNCTLR